ncbi:MAG: hypothetical protein ACM359_11115 [Bacillota bacterium]
MGFNSGLISFRRFRVLDTHEETGQLLLDGLAEHAFQASPFPEEVEYGWSGARHIEDREFTFGRCVYGDAVHFALRIDTNRVPAEVTRSYQLAEEEALAKGNPSGWVSKLQRKQAKDTVRQKVEADLKSGKYRRSRLIPVLWDVFGGTLYSPISATATPKLFELFERSFDPDLFPLTAGTLALDYLEPRGDRRDYEDARPTRFVLGPEGEGQQPEYPWCPLGPQPKDFLGNEFLLWLWWRIETHGGVIKTAKAGDVAAVLTNRLELDCTYGQTGKDGIKSDGPTLLPEARAALRTGKIPRRVGLILESGGQFELTLQAETFACTGVKLPAIEAAEDARVLFEERIGHLRTLTKALDALFETFLSIRFKAAWPGELQRIREWIQKAK